jgi:hypothetical protein
MQQLATPLGIFALIDLGLLVWVAYLKRKLD